MMSENTIKTPDILNLDYRFEKLLGEGTNGRTWLGVHRQSGNKVAIKELKLSDDIKSLEFFEREAQVLQSVNIQGVPRFYEYVTQNKENDTSYIIQEYIPHPSIQCALDDGRIFTENEVLQVMNGIAAILLDLQTKYFPPIIHRDIKPANIMFDDSDKSHISVWLIDFGAVANPQKQSGGSTIAGTCGYMAPEQLQGECAIQSDYYALGATALHMLTATSPYNIDVELFKLQYEPVLADKAPDTTDHFKLILEKLLAPNVSDRPQNASELIELLNDKSKTQIDVVQNRSLLDRLFSFLHRTISKHSISWKSSDAIIYTSRSSAAVSTDGKIGELFEAVYEYNNFPYHAFICSNNQAIRFFCAKYMPDNLPKSLMNRCKVLCQTFAPQNYQVSYQRIWLASYLYNSINGFKIPTHNLIKLMHKIYYTTSNFIDNNLLYLKIPPQVKISTTKQLKEFLQIMNQCWEKIKAAEKTLKTTTLAHEQLFSSPSDKQNDTTTASETDNNPAHDSTNSYNTSDVDDLTTLLLKEKKKIINNKLSDSRLKKQNLINNLHEVITDNANDTPVAISTKASLQSKIDYYTNEDAFLRSHLDKIDQTLNDPASIVVPADLDALFDKNLHTILTSSPNISDPYAGSDKLNLNSSSSFSENCIDILNTLTSCYHCINATIYKLSFNPNKLPSEMNNIAVHDNDITEELDDAKYFLSLAMDYFDKTSPRELYSIYTASGP